MLLAVGLVLACGAPEDARPDVVLISIDSLRADHLGCYGYGPPTSPTLDRLASEGVVFESAVSTTSWTLPAHAALFTGLYDSRHGVVEDRYRLAAEHTTLAERLAAAGYRTGGFFGGPYLHETFGLDQGFAVWRSCMSAVADDAPPEEVEALAFAPSSRSHEDVTGPRTLERVSRWLDETDPADDAPLFLFVHLWDVHYDYVAPAELVALFDPDYAGDLDGRGVVTNPRLTPDLPERDRRHLLALYDAEIRFTDGIVAGLLERLAARGRLANTLLVVTADHGEEFLEHGGVGHRKTLFDEVLRVPLIVRWPVGGVRAGHRVADVVRLPDLLPTILAAVGLPAAEGLAGPDLGPLLRGGSLPPAPALAELHGAGRSLFAWRARDHKLIRWGPGRFSLYDLARDPGERRPEAGASVRFRAAVGSLRTELARVEGGGAPPESRSAPSPEIAERLRALGYLDDAPQP